MLAVLRAADPALRAVVPAFFAVVRAELAVLLADDVADLRARVAAAFLPACTRLVDFEPPDDDADDEREPDERDVPDERELDERDEPPDDDPDARDDERDDDEREVERDVERRRRPPDLRRSAAGTSSLTTPLMSCGICRSRRVCIFSSSLRNCRASLAVSVSPSSVAAASITL